MNRDHNSVNTNNIVGSSQQLSSRGDATTIIGKAKASGIPTSRGNTIKGRSLLVDYSKNRASRHDDDDKSESIFLHWHGLKRSSSTSMLLGKSSRGGHHHGKIGRGSSLLSASCHSSSTRTKSSVRSHNYSGRHAYAGSLSFANTGRRQPLYPSRRQSSRTQRVSTVLEMIDLEDLEGMLSDSEDEVSDSEDEEEEEAEELQSEEDSDDESIDVASLQEEEEEEGRKSKKKRGSSSSSCLDDSDVYFALRRSFALPVRSATFEQETTKSSTQRLSDSLFERTAGMLLPSSASEEEEKEAGGANSTNIREDPAGRRSQLALARARMQNSTRDLIGALKQEEEGANFKVKPRERLSFPNHADRSAQLNVFGNKSKSTTSIWNNARSYQDSDCTDQTKECLKVQGAADEPEVQTKDRISSLRLQWKQQRHVQETLSSSTLSLSSSTSHRRYPSRCSGDRRSKSGSNLTNRMKMTMNNRGRNSTWDLINETHENDEKGPLLRHEVVASDSSSPITNKEGGGGGGGGGHRSNDCSSTPLLQDDSSGTVDHQRRRCDAGTLMDSSSSSSRNLIVRKSSLNRINLLEKSSSQRSLLMTRQQQEKTLPSTRPGLLTRSSSRSSSRRNLMMRGTSRSNLMWTSSSAHVPTTVTVVANPTNRSNLMSQSQSPSNKDLPALEKQSSRRNLMRRGASRSNLAGMEVKSTSRRNLMQKLSSRSNLMEKSPSRRNLMSRCSSRSNLLENNKSTSCRSLMMMGSSSTHDSKGVNRRNGMNMMTSTSSSNLLMTAAEHGIGDASPATRNPGPGFLMRGSSQSNLLGGSRRNLMHHHKSSSSRSILVDDRSNSAVMTMADNSHFVTGSRIRRL